MLKIIIILNVKKINYTTIIGNKSYPEFKGHGYQISRIKTTYLGQKIEKKLQKPIFSVRVSCRITHFDLFIFIEFIIY